MKVKIKLLNDKAKLPIKGSELAAGYDLHACLDQDEFIMPYTTKKISTGIAIQCPKGYFGAIFARSGLATKKGLRPATCVSVIDEDFRGEVFVPLHNDLKIEQRVQNEDRIAQLIFLPVLQNVKFDVCDKLDETERGSGGFGSTGK